MTGTIKTKNYHFKVALVMAFVRLDVWNVDFNLSHRVKCITQSHELYHNSPKLAIHEA